MNAPLSNLLGAALGTPDTSKPAPSGHPDMDKPYAYEFGRVDTEGRFSVVIEHAYPLRAKSDWPIVPLFRRPPPPEVIEPVLPELNADLIDILGRPNFTCIRLAQLLRLSGVEIASKAEAEQATVIHYLLGFYLLHGSQWAEKAAEDIARRRARVDAALPSTSDE
ncbi:MAG: hypothetical protein K0S02_3948 [Achromobacter mucicolens]|jgi:hypothetical protein|uniref:hypothetical protein n=1 Tax=Achromobacter mucicolens TaxID=1389922 RepID=UPI001CBCDE9A|nr:hypothetical protein [Achromobacter mucicolens]MDF2863676.1 hypothetical protein [Achromobacter mucicolens]UAN03034.1 hypothetical protein K9D24_02305 [Achromobacter mucicolens]